MRYNASNFSAVSQTMYSSQREAWDACQEDKLGNNIKLVLVNLV